MSIKPHFGERILAGTKKVEFRKMMLPTDVQTVFLYAVAPVKLVIGRFEVQSQVCGHPNDLWEDYHEIGGVSQSAFMEYFSGRRRGIAILVGMTTAFDSPCTLREVGWPDNRPPLSFGRFPSDEKGKRVV